MFDLCEDMRAAISKNRFPDFVVQFLQRQFRSALSNTPSETSTSTNSPFPVSPCNIVSAPYIQSTVTTTSSQHVDDLETAPCPPLWVRDALFVAGIDIRAMYDWRKATTDKRNSMTAHNGNLTIHKRRYGGKKEREPNGSEALEEEVQPEKRRCQMKKERGG